MPQNYFRSSPADRHGSLLVPTPTRIQLLDKTGNTNNQVATNNTTNNQATTTNDSNTNVDNRNTFVNSASFAPLRLTEERKTPSPIRMFQHPCHHHHHDHRHDHRHHHHPNQRYHATLSSSHQPNCNIKRLSLSHTLFKNLDARRPDRQHR